MGHRGGLLLGLLVPAHHRLAPRQPGGGGPARCGLSGVCGTAAAKKRWEEEATAAAVAAVEPFKQQEELEAGTWAEGDGEAATSEGDAEADVIVIHSD
jgi:hypothetical protein